MIHFNCFSVSWQQLCPFYWTLCCLTLLTLFNRQSCFAFYFALFGWFYLSISWCSAVFTVFTGAVPESWFCGLHYLLYQIGHVGTDCLSCSRIQLIPPYSQAWWWWWWWYSSSLLGAWSVIYFLWHFVFFQSHVAANYSSAVWILINLHYVLNPSGSL